MATLTEGPVRESRVEKVPSDVGEMPKTIEALSQISGEMQGLVFFV